MTFVIQMKSVLDIAVGPTTHVRARYNVTFLLSIGHNSTVAICANGDHLHPRAHETRRPDTP
jgi:hypothetical protein